nr:homoserine O-acetyltransferase [Devriesea agamarum]
MGQQQTASTSRRSRPADQRPTGAWLAGDPIGHRQFAHVGDLPLENGHTLPDVQVAYETWGTYRPDAPNAVLVLHALTGDSHVTGPAGPGHPTPGWWDDLVGPGKPLDPARWFIVAPNVLGGCQGSTGPSSLGPDGNPWGSRFPILTVRDQVSAENRLREHLGIAAWSLVIGGSMGGMRALEWAITHPTQVQRLALIATTACSSADQIAWNSAQIEAIRSSAGFNGGDYYHDRGDGPSAGLGIARRIAHITYRTADELDQRFGQRSQTGEDPSDHDGRHAVTSYLDHHADKLIRRFDANSYIALVRAMNTHDVGRHRGGVEAALSQVTARTLVVGIDTDRLFPYRQSQRIADGISQATLHRVHSPRGHDAFLASSPEISEWLQALVGDTLFSKGATDTQAS